MEQFVSDSVDISAPGGVYLLYRKLQKPASRRQIARGARCTECKRTKRKCDGGRPCSRCMGLGLVCSDPDGRASKPEKESLMSQNDAWLELATPTVDWPVGMPDSYVFPQMDVQKTMLQWPLDAANIMRVGFDYGMPSDQLHRMFSPLSSKVLGTLSELVARLSAAGPPPLQPLPESVNMFDDSHTLMRGLSRRSANNMYDVSTFNESWNKVAGLHVEEMSSRLASKSLPQPTTELRGLTNHLQFLYNTLKDPFSPQTLFTPIRLNHARACDGEEKWIIVRITTRAFSDGFIINGVRLSPEEYDAGVSLDPQLRGLFLQCDMSGEEIVNSTDLCRRETLSVMMQSAQGRARLEYLADKVALHFGINANAFTPPPPAQAAFTPSPTAS